MSDLSKLGVINVIHHCVPAGGCSNLRRNFYETEFICILFISDTRFEKVSVFYLHLFQFPSKIIHDLVSIINCVRDAVEYFSAFY